ncbi:DegT/DnrJ/EryC1/StrS family aminotransferase [Tunturibacter empetritectus]|uniref:dTDP-4-amino-4,6-dideoxygalactose transaminase n=1 Tax=Tunturiibacter lichenicola TaxID=2051959 RepID=A0A7W8J553_9BACT|nr:DegT/DnrJ/EryC1/StrS family aminotransferase [Edaphobacter lichenicola]MBB5342825.1 dTDP-4-amino-4,6-dideoxygalactose transaminase [Edaphobacter lichenicola]
MADVNLRKPQPVPMLDFSRQFAVLRQEILDSIEAVCNSQHFILGPQVTSFEQAASAACAVPHAIGCASGTDAIWLALAAANVGPGDAVITTPFSFFATVSAILRCGATPLLADIDPVTFNLSAQAVEKLLDSPAGRNVKAILPVHLYGQCADWDAFTVLKQNHNLLLIEDAAQAFGATWNGVPAGALGDAAAFSFYPTKNLSAMGDAGLVTTTSAAIDDHARILRAHGMRRRYYHEEIGWNSRLDSIQAAVLEVKLRYLPKWNQQRRDHALRYDQLFHEANLTADTVSNPDKGIVLPITDRRAGHVFHQYVIRAPRRDELRQYLTERKIGSEIYYPVPLHLQTSLSHLGYKQGDFPISEAAAQEVLALPMYPELREDEQQTVVDTIASFYQ